MGERWPKTEAELAAAVMDWLAADGWDCYPEVEGRMGRADIIAVRHGLYHVVECKRSLSLDLIEQAVRWNHQAHFVSVAVPFPKRSRRGFGERILRREKIGLIECQSPDFCMQRIPPGVNRPRSMYRLGDFLDEDQKRFVPGRQHGYSTPFSRTMDRVRAYIRANPGCTIREVIENCEHHYATAASARKCVANALLTHQADGIRVDEDGGYHVTEKAA